MNFENPALEIMTEETGLAPLPSESWLQGRRIKKTGSICPHCLEPVLAEIKRVLKPGGKLAITDMATSGALPEDIAGVLAPWTCLADTVNQETYEAMFTTAGFTIQTIADESTGLISLVRQLRRKLLLAGAGALAGGMTPDFDFAGPDLASIKFWLDRFEKEVKDRSIRYLRFNLQN